MGQFYISGRQGISSSLVQSAYTILKKCASLRTIYQMSHTSPCEKPERPEITFPTPNILALTQEVFFLTWTLSIFSRVLSHLEPGVINYADKHKKNSRSISSQKITFWHHIV